MVAAIFRLRRLKPAATDDKSPIALLVAKLLRFSGVILCIHYAIFKKVFTDNFALDPIFSKKIIMDVLYYEELKNCKITLMDINPQKLENTFGLLKRLVNDNFTVGMKCLY